MNRPRIVSLTGAGISRESGLKTFRDDDGLWHGYRIEDVCTPQALANHPERVLEFYNYRRHEVIAAEPNAAHFALARLEEKYDVTVVTQNIDDLHERGGSTKVIHIHGEVLKSRSMAEFDVVVESRGDVHLGDLAPDGAQLRPHVCFFHEMPYHWHRVEKALATADTLLVIGTSLQVYPAAGLVDMARGKRIVLIDPQPARVGESIEIIAEAATIGVPTFVERMLNA